MSLVEIGNTLVSLEIFTEKFCCDLSSCHGACCVEGDAGAPVDESEIGGLEEAAETIWDQLSDDARAVIRKHGVVTVDRDGEFVTSIVNGRDCVFTCHEDGCCYCAIERACRNGGLNVQKPLSCHLYPIRVSKVGDSLALNYHRWSICRPAVELGKRMNLPLYKFLREPLIRAFGQEWWDELELVASELGKQGYLDEPVD